MTRQGKPARVVGEFGTKKLERLEDNDSVIDCESQNRSEVTAFRGFRVRFGCWSMEVGSSKSFSQLNF